jgi:predicted PurR-regulated permease PerM
MSIPLTQSDCAATQPQGRALAPASKHGRAAAPLQRSEALRLALLGGAAVLLWRLSDIVLMLFFAGLIATVLRGIADTLARWLRISPAPMLGLVAVALVATIIAATYWIGPAVAGQASDLVSRVAQQWQHLRAQYGQTQIGHLVTSHLSGSQGLSNEIMGYVMKVAGSTLGTIGELVVVVATALYLAAAPQMYVEGVVSLVPQSQRPLARTAIEQIGHALRLWCLGQLVDMATVGVLSAIGLYLLGVPVPFALATLAGLLTIVPYFGALAAGVPGVMVGLTVSWMTAVWVVVIFTICHCVEGYLVAPLVQRHMVRLPPALAIVSMTIAAALFGPFGIILGTPLAVAILVAVRCLYVQHVLGGGSAAGDAAGRTAA